MEKKNLVFFIGGRDAEMDEIKKVLAEQGCSVEDKKLGWGAKASAYGKEIAEAIIAGKTPVLVELENDLIPMIDHHGNRASEPASIMQVLDVLGLQPSRWQQLIAANDSGYIPAMQNLGATPEEIASVRLADRTAQGITPEQEKIAEAAVAKAKKYGNLTVVRMSHSKSATVTDRMFGQYKNLLITSEDGEVNFFGDGALCSSLKDKVQGSWAGGSGLGQVGGNAYWGGYPNQDEILEFVKANS